MTNVAEFKLPETPAYAKSERLQKNLYTTLLHAFHGAAYNTARHVPSHPDAEVVTYAFTRGWVTLGDSYWLDPYGKPGVRVHPFKITLAGCKKLEEVRYVL